MSSETMVTCHVTTRCHNPEDLDVKFHRREKLKSRIRLHKPESSQGSVGGGGGGGGGGIVSAFRFRSAQYVTQTVCQINSF
jgi:hypothetical protein